jgi:hypothetical protein
MLARHSSINLTMNAYTHLGLVDLKAAINDLPPPPSGNSANGKSGPSADEITDEHIKEKAS